MYIFIYCESAVVVVGCQAVFFSLPSHRSVNSLDSLFYMFYLHCSEFTLYFVFYFIAFPPGSAVEFLRSCFFIWSLITHLLCCRHRSSPLRANRSVRLPRATTGGSSTNLQPSSTTASSCPTATLTLSHHSTLPSRTGGKPSTRAWTTCRRPRTSAPPRCRSVSAAGSTSAKWGSSRRGQWRAWAWTQRKDLQTLKGHSSTTNPSLRTTIAPWASSALTTSSIFRVRRRRSELLLQDLPRNRTESRTRT